MYTAHESDYYEDLGDSFQRLVVASITGSDNSQRVRIRLYTAKHTMGSKPIWEGTLADLVELVKYTKTPQASQ